MCEARVELSRAWSGGFAADIRLPRGAAAQLVDVRMPGARTLDGCSGGAASLLRDGCFTLSLSGTAGATCNFTGHAAMRERWTAAYRGAGCHRPPPPPPRLSACADVTFAWGEGRGVLTLLRGWRSGRKVRLDFGGRGREPLRVERVYFAHVETPKDQHAVVDLILEDRSDERYVIPRGMEGYAQRNVVFDSWGLPRTAPQVLCEAEEPPSATPSPRPPLIPAPPLPSPVPPPPTLRLVSQSAEAMALANSIKLRATAKRSLQLQEDDPMLDEEGEGAAEDSEDAGAWDEQVLLDTYYEEPDDPEWEPPNATPPQSHAGAPWTRAVGALLLLSGLFYLSGGWAFAKTRVLQLRQARGVKFFIAPLWELDEKDNHLAKAEESAELEAGKGDPLAEENAREHSEPGTCDDDDLRRAVANKYNRARGAELGDDDDLRPSVASKYNSARGAELGDDDNQKPAVARKYNYVRGAELEMD
ncbi:hypothetical protein AB1Y20_003096 [Prymnesium parvum]|uniref:Uncharacterized protein n=1 Tax=Prymnesium parvum TaxID=97485 RepID=A0AB34JCG1_PRYPA